MFLDDKTFATVIASTPLFAIDLVVVNDQDQLLVGKRLNRPAKDFWFVLGGRVLKNEPLAVAFKRLTQTELGVAIEFEKAQLLGLFEHFYKDSFFGEQIDTHYINAAHFLHLNADNLALLPFGEQHTDYQWLPISEIENHEDVHSNTKAYLPYILKIK